MKQWVCSICGSDTSNVDYDYLVNYDHVSCHLGVWGGKDIPTHKNKLNKKMKIKSQACKKLNEKKTIDDEYTLIRYQMKQN